MESSIVSAAAIELSIVMPSLNEAETLAFCIDKAQAHLVGAGIVGEVVIANDGSTDGPQQIAVDHGARVVAVEVKGYGNALMGGIIGVRGTYVIMGDADNSYDLGTLDQFVDRLRGGDELVMGNRFRRGIEPGARPPLHKFRGNPVLSTIGLTTTGMEFASEIDSRRVACQRSADHPGQRTAGAVCRRCGVGTTVGATRGSC